MLSWPCMKFQSSAGYIYRHTHTQTCVHGKVLFVSWKRVPVPTVLPDSPSHVIRKQGKLCLLPGIHLWCRDLWKTDLSTSLPFGKLQGFPHFPAGQTAQLTAPAPVLLPRAPWTSLKPLCVQSSECGRPPHNPLLDMWLPQPRKVFLAESYLVSKSSSHCPQGHSYAFLWGFRALPTYLTVVFVFISVSSSKPYDLSKVKNSLLLISASSTSGPAPATK